MSTVTTDNGNANDAGGRAAPGAEPDSDTRRFVQDVLDAAARSQRPFYMYRVAEAAEAATESSSSERIRLPLQMSPSEDGPPRNVPFAVAAPGDAPQTILDRIGRLLPPTAPARNRAMQ